MATVTLPLGEWRLRGKAVLDDEAGIFLET